MITGVEHIAVFSGDPESLRDWYARVFQFRIVKENDSRRTYWLQAPDGMLFELKLEDERSGRHGQKTGGLNHIAVATDTFDEAVALLLQEGVKVITEPTISATGGKTFFFRDPDGNKFQLISRAKPLFPPPV